MKKLILILLVLLGFCPYEQWVEMSSDQKAEFVFVLAKPYCERFGCSKLGITIEIDEDMVKIYRTGCSQWDM